jgi:hypothetical protein
VRAIPAFIAIAAMLAAPPAICQVEEPMLVVAGTAGDHTVTIPSERGVIYSLMMSPDLLNWTDLDLPVGGTGEDMIYRFETNADRFFYRTYYSTNPAYFVLRPLPLNGGTFQMTEGVPFHFYLDVLTQMPARIDIFKEPTAGGSSTLIGRLSDPAVFSEIDGIKFVRGSVVWVPDAVGQFTIRAKAYDAADIHIASSVFQVTIIPDIPPTVVITGGPLSDVETEGNDPPESPDPQPIEFTTQVSDDVVRVEFFDNGVLIGSDTRAPFGSAPDAIDDPQGNKDPGAALRTREGPWVNPWFRRGYHVITAKAYNRRGISGVTPTTYEFGITSGNARPVLNISYPASVITVEQGSTFHITYTASDSDGPTDLHYVSIGHIGDPVSAGATVLNPVNAMGEFDPIVMATSFGASGSLSLGTHYYRAAVVDHSGAESYKQFITVRVVPIGGSTYEGGLVDEIADDTMMPQPTGVLYTGRIVASGKFTGGTASGLQFDAGVGMTTGLFASWNGGDLVENKEFFHEILGDLAVQDYTGAPLTTDAAVLEFDVFPPANHGQLELELQFGSEEYIEWVGADGFNDAFLVIVDGGAVSLLPDTSGIIAVTTIHPHIAPSQTMVPNQTVALPSINEHLYLDDSEITPPVLGQKVEYDGMTICLRLHALISPLQTHKVRISITDMKDTRFDSALFLKSSSLRTLALTP